MPEKKKPRRKRATLVYPKHAFQPEEWLRFIHLKPFEKGWKDLGLDDDDLAALEVLVMLDPRGAPIVQGTGGLRKLRFAPAKWRRGKRGAARVGYVYFEELGVALLVIVYPKGEKDNLSLDEKAKIKKLIETIRREFEQETIK